MCASVTRRRYLLAAAAGSVTGLAGCSGGNETACSSITVESPDGASNCVTPVESDQPIREYYGYSRDGNDSASTPDGLEVNDAIVSFVYRNTGTEQESLVTILGDATATSDGGGNVAMSFEGVSGYQWQVQDGPPAPGSGDADPYQTSDGEFGSEESVIWGWDDGRTDGGALGPLGDSFDITVTSLAEGSVGDQTQARQGLDRWVLVDGATPDDPVELTSIDGDSEDISVRVQRG